MLIIYVEIHSTGQLYCVHYITWKQQCIYNLIRKRDVECWHALQPYTVDVLAFKTENRIWNMQTSLLIVL